MTENTTDFDLSKNMEEAPHPPAKLDENQINKILNFNPHSRIAWGWFFAQSILQLYAATYFGCMAKLAELPKSIAWLFWPTVIASAGVNYLLHLTCAQASYRLLEERYRQAKTIGELHQNADNSSYIEAASLVLEIASVAAIAGLSLVPYISIDGDIKDVCPFFSNLPTIPLTILCFFWVGFPAGAAALPWASAPLDRLLQTIASSFRLTDYFPGLETFWARRSIALPLDAMQATIHQTLNQTYWNKYDLEKKGRTFSTTHEISKIEQNVSLAICDVSALDVDKKQALIDAFLALYQQNKDKTLNPPSRPIEFSIYFLIGWLSYFAYFIPTAQDKQLHPSIVLASILVCSFLCVIAANSVSSIFHSFFPKKNEKTMANYYYHYRSLSATLAVAAVALIIAAFLSAAPCLGLSQQELLDKLPKDSWFSVAALIFFVAGTTLFNFAFCADSLQEVTNTYYTTLKTDNITAQHFWALMLSQEMIKGFKHLPPEICKQILDEMEPISTLSRELLSAVSFERPSSFTLTTSSSISTPLITSSDFESGYSYRSIISAQLLKYTPINRLLASAETMAILLQLANFMAAPRLYQQNPHGMEVYAIGLGVSILCKYLIPMDFSLEKLREVTCSSLFTILVGLTLDQAFLTYLLGSLSTNTWQLNPNEGNSVISKSTSLGMGLIAAALYSPHATKLTQDYLSQKFGPRGN